MAEPEQAQELGDDEQDQHRERQHRDQVEPRELDELIDERFAIVAQPRERRERDVDHHVRDRLHRLEDDLVGERVDAEPRDLPKKWKTIGASMLV